MARVRHSDAPTASSLSKKRKASSASSSSSIRDDEASVKPELPGSSTPEPSPAADKQPPHKRRAYKRMGEGSYANGKLYRRDGRGRRASTPPYSPSYMLFTKPRQREYDRMTGEELLKIGKGKTGPWREMILKALRFGANREDTRKEDAACQAIRDALLEYRSKVFGSEEPRGADDPDKYDDVTLFREPATDPFVEAEKYGGDKKRRGRASKQDAFNDGATDTSPEQTVGWSGSSKPQKRKGNNRIPLPMLNEAIAQHQAYWPERYPNAADLPIWGKNQPPTEDDIKAFCEDKSRCFGPDVQGKRKNWGRQGWQAGGIGALRQAMIDRDMTPRTGSWSDYLPSPGFVSKRRRALLDEDGKLDQEAFQIASALLKYEIEAGVKRHGGKLLGQVQVIIDDVASKLHHKDGGDEANLSPSFFDPGVGTGYDPLSDTTQDEHSAGPGLQSMETEEEDESEEE